MLGTLLSPKTKLGRCARRVRESLLDYRYAQTGMVRVVNGVPLRIVPGKRASFPAEYDAPVATFLRERIKPGMTCFNVGANLGIYALQFAHWNAPTGRVFAFEPNPTTAGVLRHHIAINNLASRVTVVERAVAAETGTATFHAEGTDGMSRLGTANPLLEHNVTIQVQVTTLDLFCEQENVRPDWSLIDVEGFEPAVLAGFEQTLAMHPQLQLVVEMHPNAWHLAGYSREQFEQLLNRLHLRPVGLTGQKDPIVDYGLVHMERR